MLLLALSAGGPVIAAPPGTDRVAVLMSGSSCPDAAITALLSQRLRDPVPHHRTAAAVARVRADRALVEARRLYTGTNFTGCISLLSISELELGRSLADPDLTRQQRAHELLARVALWLGICQWASGEPQAAHRSFVRAAQLPSSPAPDPRLLPPELVAAYRKAVAEPREDISCSLDPLLGANNLQVDGKGPTVAGDDLKVPQGTHYLVVKIACQEGDARCAARQQQVGRSGMRSLRLEATSRRCRIQLPALRVQPKVTCINPAEAALSPFVAAVTREAGSRGTLVVAAEEGRVSLKMHARGAASFQHQLVSAPRPGETLAQLVGRSLPLLLSGGGTRVVEPPESRPARPGYKPWYRRWWVWVAAGGAVAALVTTAAVVGSSGDDRVTVVVGR